jgi:adenine-specific DNA-methyltransferase
MTEKELLQQKENRILKLEKEIEKWKKAVKKEKYGLVWFPVPEAFEDDVENKLPILEEITKCQIKGNADPAHILIEGDNYHSLTCLNYTHKGKIDFIYIDPPYNTGKDGFRYKDKRIIDEYPDGTEVPVDHPFRHSYWLSFMQKRLELSRDILSENGVIFISIDDNEFSQLKLLCDEIFGENNFVQNFMWLHGKGKKDTWSRTLQQYILCYAKNKNELASWSFLASADYDFKNPDNDPRGAWFSGSVSFSEERSNKKHKNYYEITSPSGIVWKRQWQCTEKEMEEYLKDKKIFFGIAPKYDAVPRLKIFPDDTSEQIPQNIIEGVGTTRDAQKYLDDLFGKKVFDYPKPVALIKWFLERVLQKDDAIILDYFAGSGTTAEAVLEYNQEKDKKCQFILVTNDEGKIMSEVCYPRLEKINKRFNVAVKYYKNSFVGKHNILDADDKDKILLAHHAGEMLAIAENTLDQVKKNDYWQLFENKNQMTAVYFREEQDKFDEFIDEVLSLKKPVVVYMFSWEESTNVADFEDNKNINLKTIPQPILEIYKQIYNII